MTFPSQANFKFVEGLFRKYLLEMRVSFIVKFSQVCVVPRTVWCPVETHNNRKLKADKIDFLL